MKQKSVDASGRYFLRGAQPRSVEHAKPETPAAPSANPVKKEPEEKTESDQMDTGESASGHYSLRSKGAVDDAAPTGPSGTLQI